jgi:hypothetical protein
LSRWRRQPVLSIVKWLLLITWFGGTYSSWHSIFWSSKILIILSAINLHILRSYCKNYITGSHILHTFDLHFCTLILFSVLTLNFIINFLICTTVSFIMTQSLQVPLCRLRHLYQEDITLAILRVMNPIAAIILQFAVLMQSKKKKAVVTWLYFVHTINTLF